MAVHVHVAETGPGVFEHDLACWLCHSAPAVYVAAPHWSFAPCWACQHDLAPLNAEAWWPVAEERRRERRWWRWS